MKSDINSNQRKIDHIEIVLQKNVEPTQSSFQKYKLPYSALPEIALEDIDTSTMFLDKKISFPFIISSMTGGPLKASVINRNLAVAAEKAKVALGLGSMRALIGHPERVESFKVRDLCPSIPLFANLGLVQLNYGFGVKEINELIDMIQADGIFLHINHMQEAIQPEGNTDYSNLIPKLGDIIDKIKKPVIIKEVGSGIDFNTSKKLSQIGIKWIDVSGTGGTSWSWVEGYRRDDRLGHIFNNVGIPADRCLKESRNISGLNLIAGGGIRNGRDIAISLALGAKLATAAKPLLEPALESDEAAYNALLEFRKELEVAMFSTGVKNIDELSKLEVEQVG